MSVEVVSDLVRVVVREQDGALVTVQHRDGRLNLVQGEPGPAIEIELADQSRVIEVLSCTVRPEPGGVLIDWTLAEGISARARIAADGPDVRFQVRAWSDSGALLRMYYPVIGGCGPLAHGGADELLHSHGTGLVLQDPVRNLPEDPENRRCLSYSPYPEGFSGSTLQMLAYYTPAEGGYRLWCDDVLRRGKGFGVARHGDNLKISTVHLAEEPTATRIAPAYDVILSAVPSGGWTAAADGYAKWVRQQPWCSERPDNWLRSAVGLSVFGLSAAHDRSRWIRYLDAVAGAPVFHVLGPDWTASPQDYLGNMPAGEDEWFPASVHPANRTALKENSDRFALFEFDLLCAARGPEADLIASARLQSGANSPIFGWSRRAYMCAGSDYWRARHRRRDTRLVTEAGVNALYYDISVSNLPFECLSSGHHHRAGGGYDVQAAFARMYRSTRAAAEQAGGGTVLVGTEAVNEATVDLVDYYQSRAASCPVGPFELDPFRDWIADGRAQHVPLFAYVFGARRPLALDGWTQLNAADGDLAYWTAAQSVINGGVLELNYEFCRLDLIDGEAEDPAEHYWKFTGHRSLPVEPSKQRFVSGLSATRLAAAQFTTHGDMLPPPVIDTEEVALSYTRTSMFIEAGLGETGAVTVPAVQASAWALGSRVGLVASNATSRSHNARIDGREYTLPAYTSRFVELTRPGVDHDVVEH